MKSVNTHSFAVNPTPKVQRSKFQRDHTYKTTFNSGELIPVYLDEVLPGDTKDLSATFFCRLATPIVPIMDNLYVTVQYFWVPNRLVWDHWKNLNGELDHPGDHPKEYLVPQVNIPSGGWEVGSLADYFGLPVKDSLGSHRVSVSALPFRAYNLIWNEWYRDENLQNPATVHYDDGPDEYNIYYPRHRGKRHDYFTSALPWPQKGDPVSLPITTTKAPVYGEAGAGEYGDHSHMTPYAACSVLGLNGGASQSHFKVSNVGGDGANVHLNNSIGTTADGWAYWLAKSDYPQLDATFQPPYADLSNVIATTVNDLREAFAIQRVLELDARGGTRYCEMLRNHFGVIPDDTTLGRPEFLGQQSFRMNFAPVQQTSATSDVSPQGHLAAFSNGAESGHAFHRSFNEHGWVIGLLSVRADLNYQQGVNRMWSRRTRFDFYLPALANLGEQPILNKEIFASGNAEDDKAFGYQERWAEYRYYPNYITGKFRSGLSDSLDVWHLAEKFTECPKLNATFIEDKPPVKRCLAVQNQPEFLLDAYFDQTDVRPMPMFSIPGLGNIL